MSLATLLVLADGRLPAGGHAHSGGFEAAVSAGRVRDVGALEGFLRGRLFTSGVVAAAFAAAACAALTAKDGPGEQPPTRRRRPAADRERIAELADGPGPREPRAAAGRAPIAELDAGPGLQQPQAATGRARIAELSDHPESQEPRAATGRARIAELDDGMDVRTPSVALRRASRAQGRALLRAGRAMWAVTDAGREPHHPVALGVVAAAAGLGPLAAATAAAHGTVTGPASAAVRLLGLDPYATHALIAALAPDCDRIAADAAAAAHLPVDDLPADGAPLLDIGAEHHAGWEVRLFAS